MALDKCLLLAAVVILAIFDMATIEDLATTTIASRKVHNVK